MKQKKADTPYQRWINIFMVGFGFFGGLASLVALDKEEAGVWYYVITIGLFLLFAGSFIWLIVYGAKNHHKFFRWLAFQFSKKELYILENKTCIYTFVSRTEMKFEKIFEIRSKVAALDSFTDRYMWSKDYKKQVMHTTNNDIISKEYTQEQWQFYCIHFDEPCAKNKIHETGIIMPSLEDPKKESQLFLSTPISEPTASVTLCVVIQNGLKFKNDSTFCNVYYDYNGRVANEKIPLKVDHASEREGDGYKISHTIPYPIRGARYQLVWKFEGE